ncbi:hypothetical protein Tco_0712448 [Tanacetum coccineum]
MDLQPTADTECKNTSGTYYCHQRGYMGIVPCMKGASLSCITLDPALSSDHGHATVNQMGLNLYMRTLNKYTKEDDIEEMDLKWQLALLSMRTRRWDTLQGNVKDLGTKIAEIGIKTALDQDSMWQLKKYLQNMALYGFFRLEKSNLSLSELEKLKQEKESNQLKIEKFDNASKSVDKLIGSQIPDKSRKGLGFGSYNVVPPPPKGLFSPPNLDLSNSGLEEFQQPEFEGYRPNTSKSVSEDTSNEVRESPDALLVEELVSNDNLEKKTVFPTVAKINFANCNYHQWERMVSGNNYTRVNYNYSAQKAHPSTQRNMAPRAVLMKTNLRPLNNARPVNTAHPKITVYSARPIPKAVNAARPNTTVVNAVRANQVNTVKASACWVWRPTKLNSASITFKRHNYVDARGRSNGCSRNMTGNMSYLLDFKNFNRGYVTFGGGAKGGRIIGKRTLKTGKLDFEDVYFVKEL